MKPAQTLALAALLLAGTGASAQDTDGSDADMEVVEEIIVTAFRRAQALQDMAASASALGADDLAERWGVVGRATASHVEWRVQSGLLGRRFPEESGVAASSRLPAPPR